MFLTKSITLLMAALLLAGCAGQPTGTVPIDGSGSTVEQEESSGKDMIVETTYEVRNGTSENTFPFPDDLPKTYDYGSGRISDWSSAAMMGRMPEPKQNHTVLNTTPDTSRIQVLYLWEEGNVPATTVVTEDMTDYFDPYDFRPYVTAIPVREGAAPKGAVVLMAGGAYQFRGDYTDTLPTAVHLRELGYQTFIVDYRLQPYTPQEGALDVARAVRFIRKNAASYGIDPNDIAVMGYSAGGIQAGEFLMHYDEDVSPTVLYVPDELDALPAHAAADGMIYSFYGRLSFGSTDVAELKAGNLPPTFYCYGTEDPFYRQFEAQVEVMKEVGVPTKTIVLDGWPHGFGGDGGWVEDYGAWLETVFASNAPASAEAYSVDTEIEAVIADPAFGSFGRLIFPADTGYYSGDTLGDLCLTWYSNIDPNKTVEIANYLKTHAEAGETVFYDIYTDAEKAADLAKENTGLFFFRGSKGAPFAVCNAGGGFAYVGAMHDSFPHALELSKKGYNAFALIYRPGAQTACEDLARAISFIFENADALGVSTEDYSLWGGSAGARIAAYLGSFGTAYFGGDDLPKPAAVIMQYTGHSAYTEDDPPTYACVGENGGIANWRTMERRLSAMNSLGIDTEFHHYPGLSHGFGLGTDTVAEGWIEDAVEFWEKQANGGRGRPILMAMQQWEKDCKGDCNKFRHS